MSHAADESDDAAVPPLPWHERLQARLADVERAAAALLAVCEEPAAQAALEVRVRNKRRTRAAQRARAQRCTYAGVPICCSCRPHAARRRATLGLRLQ